MFGYHVHEKAILNVIIPFSLIAAYNPKLFILTITAGTVSLFPLLFTPFEIVFKAIIAIFHITLCSHILSVSLNWFEKAYLIGCVPIYLFENLGHLFLPKLPFLPLLVVSDFTFLGIIYCYVNLSIAYLTSTNQMDQAKNIATTVQKNRKVETPASTRVLRKRK